LAQLPAEVYESVRPGLSAGVYNILGVPNALAAFRSGGSTAPAEVQRQVEMWQKKLASETT
jgi:argininosuccinate lyase